jgi:hypothetical protein
LSLLGKWACHRVTFIEALCLFFHYLNFCSCFLYIPITTSFAVENLLFFELFLTLCLEEQHVNNRHSQWSSLKGQ